MPYQEGNEGKMDGIIIINKEKNWTSNDVVQKVKHITNKKVGHTGTLDPLATGVLPLLIGKGTSLSKYLINHDKEYIATICLGKKTDTGDSQGNIIEKQDVPENIFNKENINQVLNSFIGENMQTPPIYSAIKINGKKLYEYARKGKQVEIPTRKITIYSIELQDFSKDLQEITYKVNCSKGTYIRTLSEDIAKKLGTVGFTKELKRTKVGDFKIEQAIKISEVQEKLEENLIIFEKFFEKNDKIKLDSHKLDLLYNGVKLNCEKQDGIYSILNQDEKLECIGVVANHKLKREIWVNDKK